VSFIGAVSASVRQSLLTITKEIRQVPLLVGAGNFTVAAVLRTGGYSGVIESCDVSLYTSALGAYLSDKPIAVSESPACPEHLRGLLDTSSNLHITATIALLADMRDFWQTKNPFQVRQFKNMKERWPGLVSETMKRLELFKKRVAPIDYQAKDGFVFLEEHDEDHAAFAFPPTYRRGYEKLERVLKEAVSWSPPPYREMTDKSLDLYRLISRFSSYFVVLEKDLPEVYEILGEPCAILPRGLGGMTYIIAKHSEKKVVIKKQAKTSSAGPIWPASRPVTGHEVMSYARITLQQSLRLNELFLSAGIDYFTGGVGVSIAYLLDGELIGKADFAPSTHQWKLPALRPMIYLMSDLAVPSETKKLAKLVLLGITSRETKRVLDLHYIEDYGWVITTAFSKHPVSMKYRGQFKLHTRKAVKNGYALNYYAAMGDHSLSEALALWKKKYGP
jgi:hypothetical protein